VDYTSKGRKDKYILCCHGILGIQQELESLAIPNIAYPVPVPVQKMYVDTSKFQGIIGIDDHHQSSSSQQLALPSPLNAFLIPNSQLEENYPNPDGQFINWLLLDDSTNTNKSQANLLSAGENSNGRNTNTNYDSILNCLHDESSTEGLEASFCSPNEFELEERLKAKQIRSYNSSESEEYDFSLSPISDDNDSGIQSSLDEYSP